MSVTFSANTQIVGYVFACSCGAAKSDEIFDDYLAAESHRDSVTVDCSDTYCAAWNLFIESVSETMIEPVNVSSANARVLLSALGFDDEDELFGEASADDFYGRVLMAEAVLPEDEGLPAFQDGVIVDCGRPDGYLQDRLSDLRELAENARHHKVDIYWS